MHPLLSAYEQLLDFFGPQNWWPGDTPLEIMVGAVLTQNTSWGNVEKAIANLKTAGLLPAPDFRSVTPTSDRLLQDEPGDHSPNNCSDHPGLQNQDQYLTALRELPTEELAGQIRSAGYYNLKARRLHNLIEHIHDAHGSLDDFLALPAATLRRELLTVKGIGPETADSICLYAAGNPVFVVDTYTHRIFSRHHLLPEEADYHTIQEIFTDALPADTQLYNEYHALIVRVGKEFCRKGQPRCPQCPLHDL